MLSRMDRCYGPAEMRTTRVLCVAVGGSSEGIRSERNDCPLGFFFCRCARMGHHPIAAVFGLGRDSDRHSEHQREAPSALGQGEQHVREDGRYTLGADGFAVGLERQPDC